MPNYYPIMLDVRGRQALVIGGDRIAAEKARALIASGAHVTIQSPIFEHEVLALHEQHKITLHKKAYEVGDLEGAFVVVAATNDRELIEAIWSEGQRRGQLVNIVDVPAYCNFIIPSILRRDQLTITVSTEGASPGLAKRIRQKLEKLFPQAYGPYLRLASVVRAHLRKHGISYDRRDDFFEDYYRSDILAYLEQGHQQQAIEEASHLLERYDIEVPTETLSNELQKAVPHDRNS